MNRPFTVLLADDEPAVQKVVSRRLEANGYRVVIARDGEEALAMARAQRPDAIVLDIMMPKMTGDDVAVHLRDDIRTAGIPVIFLTCLATPDDSVVSGGTSANRMLAKPLDGSELLTALAEIARPSA
jgi:CheY-like chemotaxis protein